MEYLFIYLLQVAEVINATAWFLLVVFIASIIIMVFVLIAMCDLNKDSEDFKSAIKTYLKIAFPLVLSTLLVFSIPTKQTLLLMGGTYLGKKAIDVVATDEKIKKVDTIINLQLDKYIKELQNGTGSVK